MAPRKQEFTYANSWLPPESNGWKQTYGPAYDSQLDGPRLGEQGQTILDYMLATAWSSLAEIERATSYPQSSISAWLRHYRKPEFGSYTVDKRRRTAGTWEYAVSKKFDINDL